MHKHIFKAPWRFFGEIQIEPYAFYGTVAAPPTDTHSFGVSKATSF
jgi:hypothetical protein